MTKKAITCKIVVGQDDLVSKGLSRSVALLIALWSHLDVHLKTADNIGQKNLSIQARDLNSHIVRRIAPISVFFRYVLSSYDLKCSNDFVRTGIEGNFMDYVQSDCMENNITDIDVAVLHRGMLSEFVHQLIEVSINIDKKDRKMGVELLQASKYILGVQNSTDAFLRKIVPSEQKKDTTHH